MVEPLVSVIIPTRDRPEKLLQAVASVLLQTWKSLEIIVVDDGSVDDICIALRSHFPYKVNFIRHDEPMGACEARNTGVRYSNGEYVAFLDDDDRWMPGKIKKQLDVFQISSDNLALVSCGYVYESEGCAISENKPKLVPDPFKKLLYGNWLGSTSLPLIRKSCLERVGLFDAGLSSCQDWDLWLRLCSRYDVATVEESLVVRTLHSGQITADIKRKIAGRRFLMAKHYSELQEYPRALCSQLRRLGTLELLAGNKRNGRKLYLEALREGVWDVRAVFGLVLSALPVKLSKAVLDAVAVKHVGNHSLYH